ncbi:MAG: NADH-quinone oxidoreductase subunit J [Chloroflexota bacterium]
MTATFYVAAVVAILATVMVITRLNAGHALLYLIVSLLSVAVVFYTLGAPFIAALEVIIYAGAIMVLFIFVIMMLNLGKRTAETERDWLSPGMWIGPCILAAILIAEVAYLLLHAGVTGAQTVSVGPKSVSIVLFGPYLIGVELASMLLLGALVGAYHLGRRNLEIAETRDVVNSDGTRTVAGGDFVRTGNDRSSGAPQLDLHPHVD